MKRTILNPNVIHPPVSAYSETCLAEGKKYLFISGQVPINSSGKLVGPGDLRAQFKQDLDNLKAVLASYGANFKNIVQTMTFLRNEENVYQRFCEVRNELFKEYFPDGEYPPSTLLIITSLYRKDVLVEYQAVAVLD